MAKEIYILKYKLENKNNSEYLKILGKWFVYMNKLKVKLIIDNKIKELSEYIPISNIKKRKNNTIKIKLIFIEETYDRSNMFDDCNSLLIISEFRNNINKENIELDKINNNNFNEIYNIGNSENNSECENFIEYALDNMHNTSYKNNLCSSISEITNKNTIYSNNSIIYFYNKIFNELTFKEVKVKNLKGMFYNCSSLISLPDISKWNTENVEDMSQLFYGCSSLISLPDISKWKTNKLTYISGLFYNCSSLIFLPDISK